ncbi:hypothetical protein IQ250_26175, partial [Pseudanabaenaceae cyanobacterium LEGE 13415]|nr:hypothetical protein [Pseudanabaenaceae cyanobacterium LEGE 13415]
FKPEVTSTPGIKIAQETRFDNRDLLSVLVNPFLDRKERDLYYLNSLNWVSLGLRPPKILGTSIENRDKNWYTFRLGRPHHRMLLQYEKAPGTATYYSVFSNPGVSASYSFEKNAVHLNQSANSTLGLLLGSLFEFIRPYRIEKSLWEARLRYSREEAFSQLRSQTTPEQRKQINQRLNQTLNFAIRSSGLDQISGAFTLPSRITTTRSNTFQFRAGNHLRRVRFTQIEQTWNEDFSYISKLRLSNETFGFLSLIGTPVPRNQTGLGDRNSTVQTVITSRTGRTFLLSDEADPFDDPVIKPMQIRSFDSAFDRMELSQVGSVVTQIKGFDGYLQLPSVEALWAGSQNNFYYSLIVGAWGNLNPKKVPGVVLDRQEPNLGIYTRAALNWNYQHTRTGKDQKIRAIATHIPSIQLAWNSAPNSVNPAYLSLGYSLIHQTRSMNLSITSGLLVAAAKDLETVAFTRSQIGLKTGLQIATALEVGDYLFWSIEGLQQIDPSLSIGAYGQNYQIASGLKDRSLGKAYGVLMQHRFPSNNTTLQTRMGVNGDRFEVRFQGTLNF